MKLLDDAHSFFSLFAVFKVSWAWAIINLSAISMFAFLNFFKHHIAPTLPAIFHHQTKTLPSCGNFCIYHKIQKPLSRWMENLNETSKLKVISCCQDVKRAIHGNEVQWETEEWVTKGLCGFNFQRQGTIKSHEKSRLLDSGTKPENVSLKRKKKSL